MFCTTIAEGQNKKRYDMYDKEGWRVVCTMIPPLATDVFLQRLHYQDFETWITMFELIDLATHRRKYERLIEDSLRTMVIFSQHNPYIVALAHRLLRPSLFDDGLSLSTQ